MKRADSLFLPLLVLVALAALVHCGGAEAADGALASDGDAGSTAYDARLTPIGPTDAAAPPLDDDAQAPSADAGPDARDGASIAYDAATWMGAVSDTSSLAELTIPGTHESCARVETVPGTAKCQDLSVAEQLGAGVRYVDIRCRHYKDTFEIHHGLIYQEMNFDGVLSMTWEFLTDHPSETILMSVKEEYEPSGNTRTFEQTFAAYVKKKPEGWYLGAMLPRLSEARGKIVLVRRFAASSAEGVDATNWADKATFTIAGPPRLRVQDEYEVSDNTKKWSAITALLDEARGGDAATLYLNYASGYKPLLLGVPNISDVSDVINPKLAGYFTGSAHRKGRYGVVAMDFVDTRRAELLLQENF